MHGVKAQHAADGQPEQTVSDKELMIRCRAGDRLALERLLTPYEKPLYHLCLGILRNAADAEDAVQETFLRAMRGLAGFRGEASVRTWLQRIAVNVCIEWKRSRKPTAPMEAAERMASTSPDLEETTIRHRLALDALGVLTEAQRAALILKDVQGLSVEEIAATMSWNAKKVENELYRARKALAVWRARTIEAEG
ncbi:MAG: RNA polymerase sigma factor [Chthonomonadales bacterium]|nr:RNA polymerase sigma factor [Chthonomonadales bacterium]